MSHHNKRYESDYYLRVPTFRIFKQPRFGLIMRYQLFNYCRNMYVRSLISRYRYGTGVAMVSRFMVLISFSGTWIWMCRWLHTFSVDFSKVLNLWLVDSWRGNRIALVDWEGEEELRMIALGEELKESIFFKLEIRKEVEHFLWLMGILKNHGYFLDIFV